MPPILTTPEIDAAIAAGAVVAIGVSGGKDSTTAVAAVMESLDARGHPRDRRLLIHSDLGEIEWRQSAEICAQVARQFSLELVTVRRAAGGLLERWESRWSSMSASYLDLKRVTLTMPFSSAALRFCTSELKASVLAAYLKSRFAGQTILSVSGIRREESPKRALAPVAKLNERLRGVTAGTVGWDWNPILDFKLTDVWAVHAAKNLPVHEAYNKFGCSRVSCSFCILQSTADQSASFANPEHRAAWRRIAELELVSGFSFQSNRWLADLGAATEGGDFQRRLHHAKELSLSRARLEKEIPRRLLYVKGWPTFVPEADDCGLLANVRTSVCALYGWTSPFLTADAVRARYAELFAQRNERLAA